MITIGDVLMTVVPSAVTGVLGWVFGRRQSNADASATEVKTFDAALDAYRKLYEERERIYENTIDQLRKQIDSVTEENKELRKQIMTVSNFVTQYMVKRATNEALDLDTMLNLTDVVK